jgi:exodeoxyribonuclease VII small subunit
MTDKTQPVQKLSYEQAFAELEQIVARLEGEQPPLEEALALYERGQALSQRCTDLLEKAELKLRQLAGDELDELSQDDSLS